MSRTVEKVPMLYVEGLRIDAYSSTRDVKRLKLLRDDYAFWSRVAPIEFRNLWRSTLVYCDMKIVEIDPRYLQTIA